MLSDGKILEARNRMKVIRLHSARNKVGNEVAFSLLLLFWHWRDELKDLKYDDPDACIQILAENEKEVDENRKAMLPYSSLRESIENIIANEERAAHVFDTIDANNEQQNLDDAEDAEPLDLTELPQESDDKNFAAKINSDSCSFKPIKFGNEDDMLAYVASLSYEQRLAFDIVLQNCKKKKIQRANPSLIVLPELLKITGMY